MMWSLNRVPFYWEGKLMKSSVLYKLSVCVYILKAWICVNNAFLRCALISLEGMLLNELL